MVETVMMVDADTWLSTLVEPEPSHPVLWNQRTAVRGIEHLSVLVSCLDPERFGVVEGGPSRQDRWAQTMRIDSTWIVEVHEGHSGDYARRVFRGEPGEYPDGEDDARLPIEEFGHFAAAQIMWAWIHSGLPEGMSRTLRHFSASFRRELGLGDL